MGRSEKAIIQEMLREFESGATRSPLGDKLCYTGFLSPLVLKRFAQYMHQHRIQSNGEIRDANNWKKGIPIPSYMDSMGRHFWDTWLHNEGHSEAAEEDLETSLCGLLFNTQGMLYEILKNK